jgi:drug/metabolite transporter (DMT)-like permease
MSPKLRSDLILLVAALIWGLAFVAQRVGMEFVGPFTFNGARFTLGALVILPFLFTRHRRRNVQLITGVSRRKLILAVIATGLLLFIGASLQQIGIKTTTAGKAGFITGLYVVLVPVAGLLFGQKVRLFMWLGVILSATGLYLLSIKSGFSIGYGDLLVLGCAFVFTFHVLLIGWLSPRMDSFVLSVTQFAICAALSILFAISTEHISFAKMIAGAIPILYGGIFSAGIAFTLQVVAQKSAHPAYASIILSLEAVFAAFAGWLILSESLAPRALLGCLLMLAGMVAVQVKRQQ